MSGRGNCSLSWSSSTHRRVTEKYSVRVVEPGKKNATVAKAWKEIFNGNMKTQLWLPGQYNKLKGTEGQEGEYVPFFCPSNQPLLMGEGNTVDWNELWSKYQNGGVARSGQSQQQQ